jgi:hypothetical protein
MLVVLAGVLHHLAISPHGPELVPSLQAKYIEDDRSLILEEARRLEELEIHRHFHNVASFPQLPESEKSRVVYKWYNPSDADPQGPFLGTRYDPSTGNLMQVDDLISKIAPYFEKDEKIESAIQIQDAPLAKDYMKVRDQLTPEQRDGVKKKFHLNITPKGHDCNTCHSKDSILDYEKLGFADNRILDLQQLNIKGMMTKYEEFYLPNLFKEAKSEDSSS